MKKQAKKEEKTKQKAQVEQRFKNNTLKMAIQLLVVFVTTSIIAVIVGRLIDNGFGISPIGSVTSLGVFYLLSWVIVAFIAKRARLDYQKVKQNSLSKGESSADKTAI